MKTGLVLSGGGARAFMHVGVLRALDERGIEVDHIVATSAGAVVGAMYAAGISPTEILEILSRPELLRSIRFAFGGKGLLRVSKVEKFLGAYFPENDFSALRIRTTITATDIAAGEMVAFHSGEILKPMLASCGIPGLFEPVLYNGRPLVDGGVLNNLPVEFLSDASGRIIGCHCNSYSLSRPLRSSFEVAYRALLLAVHHQNIARLQKCDLVIDPPEMASFSIFDFSKAREIFEVGYRSALLALDRGEVFIGEARTPMSE